MSTEERIEKVYEFLETQRYIHGLQCMVKEEGEGFIVEFKKASNRQLITLNRVFKNSMMGHITAVAQEVLEFDPPKKKKRRAK